MHDDYDFTATFDFDDSEWKAIDDALALLEEKFAMLDDIEGEADEGDFPFDAAAAHPAFAFIDRREVGVRHPRGVKVDGFHIQGFLDVVRVVQQTVIGGVGDDGVYRPGGIRRLFDAFFNGRTLEFALRNAAQNTVGVTGWTEIDRRNVAHHHQVSQRFVTVTVNQYRAARRRRVHADNFVGG